MALFYNYFFDRTRLAVALVTIITLIGLLACQSSTPAAETNQISPTVKATATIRPSRTPTIEIIPTIAATEEPEDAITILTLWTVEPISPEAEGEPGSFVDNGLRVFGRVNPDLKVDLILKKPSGKGGMLDFLRTARDVAPTVLPDIAILDATDLRQAYNDNLLQTLNGRLDRSIVQDLLPAARRMGTIDDNLVGVPLGLEIEHTVYNALSFETPPMLWTNVLTSNARYVFPAKGVNGLVNDVTLSQYFSTGGTLLDDQGIPTLDERVLRDVLNFYQQSLENGNIDATILEAATTEELWPIYLEAQAGIAQITVRQYLTDRELLRNTNFVPLPVQNEQDTPVPITHGWVFVLVTNDEQRQPDALRLIEWFLSTSNNASWNEINKSIPTRDSAYQQLAGDDPYWVFLTEQLKTAQPQPDFEGYDRVGRIIQQAVEQVIRGEATPDEATATAIDALAHE